MTESFVPFMSALKSRALANSKSDQFEPLSTQPKPTSSGPGSVSDGNHQNHQPVVSFIKEDGKITEIRIQCGCGQVIELSCQY